MLPPLDSNGWPGTETTPQPDDTGPSWPKSHAGGASALHVHRQGANLGLQGLRFATGIVETATGRNSMLERVSGDLQPPSPESASPCAS